jgi:DNA-binding CsgD family transcriptional regulator
VKQKLRVLLAISQTLMRIGLVAQITAVAPEVELEEAADFSQVQRSSCDVVIIHQTLLSERIEAIQKPFLVLTEQPTREELLLFRENMQCFGYASLYPALEPLLSYFQTTNFRQRNAFWLDPSITLLLIRQDMIDDLKLEGWENLTVRERAIFDLLKQRKTTNEIAEAMSIAACTVRTHKQHICQKLGVGAYELKSLLAVARSRK